jgi:phosphohistidine swiveling domain-containing protein
MSSQWLIPLNEVDPNQLRRFGGKAAALARLTRRGLPVPPGVVVPSEVFMTFLERSRLLQPARELLRRGEPGRGELLRRGVLAAPLPPDLAGALRREGELLGPRLVARSSAVDEDGAERSFAGQYETVVNVRPGDELEEAVKRCWASWFGERALAYRRTSLRSAPVAGMAVVIQQLVDARISGVMFTVNPVSGSWRQMVVEAAWGAGEGLVSGQIAPDRYLLRRPRRTPRPVQRVLARVRVDEEEADVVPQPRKLTPAPGGGLDWAAVDKPDERKLSPALARRVARLGLRAEALCGGPQDVEWALDGQDRVFLLQSRSVTAAGPTPRGGAVLWTRRFAGERWTEPATPMGWSIIGGLLEWFIAYPETQTRYLGGGTSTRLHRGYPYFNATVFRHLAFKLPGRAPPRFLLDLLPPDEVDRFLRRFAAPPDARVYASIFSVTWQERRWQRFRWNPWTNWRVWEELEGRLMWEIPSLSRGRRPLRARVERGIELAREYIKVHVISLLCANLWYEVGEAFAPPDLRADLLLCPAENRTVETNRALYRLAHGAPLEPFLATYGHRTASSAWEIFSPRWVEDPEQVQRLLEPYRSGGMADPAALAADQARRSAAAMRALEGRVRGVEGRALVGSVRLARRYLQLREDQRFVFDHLLFELKKLLTALGELLLGPGRGPEIRWLEWPEVIEVLEGRQATAGLEPRIAARRESWQRYRDEPPPPVFLRGDEAVEIFQGGRKLSGLGISPGRVTGPVRVIRSPAEAGRVRPGDILVATATDPGWTPMFLVASGAILELGSMLSHGAVVAREYRMPAVVNVEGATRTLKEGQRVTIDGGRGEIWLED